MGAAEKAVGIDLGGTNLRAGVVTAGGEVLEVSAVPLSDPGDGEAIVAALSQKPNVTIHVHGGVNHAFALPNGPNWNEAAANAANAESYAFLKQHLQS